jgi:hypothetical protein
LDFESSTAYKQADIKTNGNCCFNHIIELPKKQGEEKPIFDYEKLPSYDSPLIPDFYNPSRHNFKNKHLLVKKATVLRVTKFFLIMSLSGGKNTFSM